MLCVARVKSLDLKVGLHIEVRSISSGDRRHREYADRSLSTMTLRALHFTCELACIPAYCLSVCLSVCVWVCVCVCVCVCELVWHSETQFRCWLRFSPPGSATSSVRRYGPASSLNGDVTVRRLVWLASSGLHLPRSELDVGPQRNGCFLPQITDGDGRAYVPGSLVWGI